jgi:hypothetical protein
MPVVPVVDVRNTLETGGEQFSDRLATLRATPPRVMTSRKVEDRMIAEKSHDFVEVVPVEGVKKCLEHADAYRITRFRVVDSRYVSSGGSGTV